MNKDPASHQQSHVRSGKPYFYSFFFTMLSCHPSLSSKDAIRFLEAKIDEAGGGTCKVSCSSIVYKVGNEAKKKKFGSTIHLCGFEGSSTDSRGYGHKDNTGVTLKIDETFVYLHYMEKKKEHQGHGGRITLKFRSGEYFISRLEEVSHFFCSVSHQSC